MKRIELYIDDSDRLVLSLFKSIDSEYEAKVLRGIDTYDGLKQLANNKIVDIYENPNGEDITLEYNDYIININDYEKVLPKRGLGPIRENLKKYEESLEIKKVHGKKVTRKNKYSGKKIIATGLALLSIATCIYAGVNKAKASNIVNDNKTSSYEYDNEVNDYNTVKLNNNTFKLDNNTKNMSDATVSVSIDYNDRSDTKKAQTTKAYYGELIQKYASMYGLDANLVRAIATQEKGIHSSIMDEGGATGLMQIQNSVWLNNNVTAYNFKTKTYETLTVNEKNIGEISSNIKIGCMILQNNMKYMNYNTLAGIQCYNMGYGNMKKILTVYAKETNRTIDQVLNDVKDTGWLNYRNIIKVGDTSYVEHVLSWLGDNININIEKDDLSNIGLNLISLESKKMIS